VIAWDLFCCAGGATEGLSRAGFAVYGFDLVERPTWARRFGADRFSRIDALALLDRAIAARRTGAALCCEGREGRGIPLPDFVWASPPCQRHSSATRQSGNPDRHPDLIAPTRERLRELGAPYVIENVLGAPLIDPIMLCGAMFDLGVVRHRLFEFSWQVVQPAHPKHKGSLVTGEYVTVAGNGGVPAWTLKERERRGLPRHREGEYSLENWSRAMGIDWMPRDELVEAIPPAFAEWIGREALDQIYSEGAHRMLTKAGS
jgi:DNA (cytosine-5)-methyltransferase 1